MAPAAAAGEIIDLEEGAMMVPAAAAGEIIDLEEGAMEVDQQRASHANGNVSNEGDLQLDVQPSQALPAGGQAHLVLGYGVFPPLNVVD